MIQKCVQDTLRVMVETQRAPVAGREGFGHRDLSQIRLGRNPGVGTAKQHKLCKMLVSLLAVNASKIT